MYRLKSKSIAAALFAVLAVIGLIMNSHPASAQNPSPGSAPVNIVAPLPLPVSGSFSISGNSAANPLLFRDVDNAARHPFVIEGNAARNGFTVPANTRYVIEHYNISCFVDTAGVLSTLNLQVVPPGRVASSIQDYSVPHLSFVSNQGGIPGNWWVASGDTRVYAEPGSFLNVTPLTNFGGHPNFCADQSISGYYVTLP